MAETDRLFRTESLFFTENAAIFEKRLEGVVARDVQVDIKPAAHIHDNDAEEIDSLDVGGVVVVERKNVRKFSTEDLPTGIVIIETVVPTWMPVQNPLAQWFAPGRRICRRRGLMYDFRNGHGCRQWGNALARADCRPRFWMARRPRPRSHVRGT